MSARYLLAVTAPNARQAKTLGVLAEDAALQLVTFGEPQDAIAWLERHDPRAVVLDLRVAGVNGVCRKLRSKRQLCRVPIIALTHQISDGETARFFAVGVDDVLPIDAHPQLLLRLREFSQQSLASPQHRGIAIIAEPEIQRGDVFGRVFMNAGYDIQYALDDPLLLYPEATLLAKVIVVSTKLGDPRRLIEAAKAEGSKAVWVVVAPRTDLDALDGRLAGLEGVAVIARDAPPTDALFFSNELRLPAGARLRKGERRLYGTQVRFRPVGSVDCDFGFSYNISDAGLYVRTLAPPVSERVWLEVRPPQTNEWVCLEGEVAWRRPFATESGAPVPPGFGVKLLSGLGQSLVVWKRAVRDFSRTTHRTSGGLAALVRDTLVREGLPLLVEDSLEPAPLWGAEDDDPPQRHDSVEPYESWEPVLEEDHPLVSVRPPPAPPLPRDLARPQTTASATAQHDESRELPSPPAATMNDDALPAIAPPTPQLTTVALATRTRRSPWAFGVIAAGGLLLAGSVWALAGGDKARRASPLTKSLPSAAAAAARAADPIEARAGSVAPAPSSAQPTSSVEPPSPTPAAASIDNSDLKPNEGGLIVHSQAGLRVFIQGVERGRTNERFVLPCGYRFVRLQGAAVGVWVSEGVSVVVGCRTTTEIELQAKPAG